MIALFMLLRRAPAIARVLGVVTASVATGATGNIVAQVSSSPSIGTWTNVGSTGVAVAALVYLTKLFAKGEIVARDPNAVEHSLQAIIENQTKQIDATQAIAKGGQEREDRLWGLLIELRNGGTS